MAPPRRLMPRDDDKSAAHPIQTSQADSSQHEQQAGGYLQSVANMPGNWNLTGAVPFATPPSYGATTFYGRAAYPYAVTPSSQSQPYPSGSAYPSMPAYSNVVGSGYTGVWSVNESSIQDYRPQHSSLIPAQRSVTPKKQSTHGNEIDKKYKADSSSTNSRKRPAPEGDVVSPRQRHKLSSSLGRMTEHPPPGRKILPQPSFNYGPAADPSITGSLSTKIDLGGLWTNAPRSGPLGAMPGPTSSNFGGQKSLEQNGQGKCLVVGASQRHFVKSGAHVLGESGSNDQCQLSREWPSSTFSFTKDGKKYDQIAAPTRNGSRSTEGRYKGDWSSKLSVKYPYDRQNSIDIDCIKFPDHPTSSNTHSTSRAAVLYNLFCKENPGQALIGTVRWQFEETKSEYRVDIPCTATMTANWCELAATFSIMLKTTLAE